MTRRLRNKERLKLASRAAMSAHGWVRESLRERFRNLYNRPRRILNSGVGVVARRNKYKLMSKLLRLFCDVPELAPWCEKPENLRMLARYAGASKVGGGLRTVIDNVKVQDLIAQLGEPVWRYAVTNGKQSRVLVGSVSDYVTQIDVTGGECLDGFLRRVAKDSCDDIAVAASLDRYNPKKEKGSDETLTLIQSLMREHKPSA